MKDLLNILLVEDSLEEARLIQEQLAEQDVSIGFTHPKVRLGLATTIAEARILLQQKKYDLILLDLHLPDAVELEGLKALVEEFKETPIIILTNVWDRQIMIDAIEHGAQDYLIKMYTDKERLLQSISTAIERQKRELKIRRLIQDA